MAQNYTRQSTLSDGDTITASLFNDEYNQLVNAFTYSSTSASSTGHRHDGSSGQGGNIFKIGDLDFLNKIEVDSTNNRWGFYVEVSSAAVEQIRIQDGAIVPVTTNDIDLGTASLEFKDLFIDGTAHIDTLDVDENATVAGTLGVTGTTTLTGNVTTTNDLSVGGNLTVTGTTTFNGGTITMGDAATDNVVFGADVDSNIIPDDDDTYDLGSSSQEWRNLYIDGTANIDSLVADTADINGGTIDGATIGGTTAAAGSFTTVSATGNITVGGTVDGRDVATDGAKLDGIEALADVTDTTNVTAAGALMDSELTSEASVKALNQGVATTDSPTFAGATINGTVTVAGGDAVLSDTIPRLHFMESDTTDLNTRLRNQGGEFQIHSVDDAKATPKKRIILDNATGDINFYEDTGTTAKLTWDASDESLEFADNAKATFGAGSDLQIYHDTSHSYIDEVGTGSLYVRANDFRLANATGTENHITAANGGAVSLRYAGSPKLATTSTGIDVTGTVVSDGLTVDGTIDVNLGSDGSNIASLSGASAGRKLDIQSFTVGASPGAGYSINATSGQGELDFQTAGNSRLNIDAFGDISFYEDTGTTAKFFWDASTERLGIGTTAGISAALTVFDNTGSLSATLNDTCIFRRSDGTYNPRLEIQHSTEGTTLNHTYSTGATDLMLSVADSEIMRLAPSGNVGIGTSNPSYVLDVESAGINSENLARFSSSGGVRAVINTDSDDDGSFSIYDQNDAVQVLVRSNGGSYFNGGNVGIGTSSPRSLLAAVGTGADGGILTLENDSNSLTTNRALGQIDFYSNDGSSNGTGVKAKIQAIALNSIGNEVGLTFGTSGTGSATAVEAMRIDSSGNVGIGTSSISTSKLHLQGTTGTASAVRVESTAADSDAYYIADNDASVWTWGIDGGNGDAWTLSNAFGLGTPKLTVETGGNVEIGTQATGTASSKQLLSLVNPYGNTGGAARLWLSGTNATTRGTYIEGQAQNSANNHDLIFATSAVSAAPTERMRLDSSGNLLVGATEYPDDTVNNTTGFGVASTGEAIAATNGHRAAVFKRMTSDGSLVEFYKDAASVGSIGSISSGLSLTTPSTYLVLGADDSGVRVQNNDFIQPYNPSTGAVKDATINLGASSGRFKDLYLSGTANAAGLSVDGGTIKLDGNYPTGTANVALGNLALDDGSLTGGYNVAIGTEALTANTTASVNTAVGAETLQVNTTGSANTAVGASALKASTTGSNNTAVGRFALNKNTTASNNTAVGYQSLYANTTGDLHVAIGDNSLASNTTGRYSVAVGRNASNSQTTANGTVAIGYRALEANTTGENVAVGTNSLLANTTASNNTAVGLYTMQYNTTGSQNTAVGSFALDSNTTASNNTAVGYLALTANTTGTNNTAVGISALDANTTGGYNVALGTEALSSATTASNNLAIGHNAGGSLSTGAVNVAIGNYALDAATTGANNVAVGYGTLTASNSSNNVAVGTNAGVAVTSATELTIVGYAAGDAITTGNYNTALGTYALTDNVTGERNTAVGRSALAANTASYNTAVGMFASASTTTGSANVSVGYDALGDATTAAYNVAVGSDAMALTTTGGNNTAVGQHSLYANLTGIYNVALGYNVLDASSAASYNTAVGGLTLTSFTGAGNTFNTALGFAAMENTTTGYYNTCVGTYAGNDISTATDNVFVGYLAGLENTTGSRNTAVGSSALDGLTTASNNTALGHDSLGASTTGGENVALGRSALASSTTAANNTAVGYLALYANTTAQNQVAMGFEAGAALTTGDENTAIGARALRSSTTAYDNVAVGRDAMYSNVSGGKNVVVGMYAGYYHTGASESTYNTSIGYAAGQGTANYTGKFNTSVGGQAGYGVSTGSYNASFGYKALFDASTGNYNTALGYSANENSTTGYENTVVGAAAMLNSTTAHRNVAVGYVSGRDLTTGNNNVAIGYAAMFNATDTSNSIGIGAGAGTKLTTGNNNIAIGTESNYSGTTGSGNVSMGHIALRNVTTGAYNVATGFNALNDVTTGSNNTGVGRETGNSLTTGNRNTLVGSYVATDIVGGSDNVAIGYNVAVGASIGNSITIGSGLSSAGSNYFAFGKSGNIVSNQFTSNASWSRTSDRRLKKDIENDTLGLSFINDLNTVTYRWKDASELDANDPDLQSRLDSEMDTEVVMHGLIAQDVKEALDSQGCDSFGGWSVDNENVQHISREMFVIPLIKAVQELSAQVEELKSEIETLRS